MQDKETPIAVLRRVDGLFRLVVERGEDGTGPLYKAHVRPLLRVNSNVGERELLDAWEVLGAVREIEAPVLEAIRYILATTLIDPEGDPPTLEPLDDVPPPPPPRPTAAYPRAYQGTKDRPPKPKRPAPRDLRPFLCVPGGRGRLVQLLTTHLGAIDLSSEERASPPGFRRGLAWVAQLKPNWWGDALAVHHALDLERDLPLRLATAVFANGLDQHALRWLRAAAHIEPKERIRFVELVQETDAKQVDPRAAAETLAAIGAACTEENFETRMRYALTIVKEADDPADLVPALEYADLHAPEFSFQLSHEWHGYKAPVAPRAMQLVSDFLDTYFPVEAWGAMNIWNACCIARDLPEELRYITEAALDPEGARLLGRVLADAIVDDHYDLPIWKTLRVGLRKFVAALGEVPFQYKAAHLVWELVWEDSLDLLDWMTQLVPIVCAEPFAKQSHVEYPLARLGKVSSANKQLLLEAGVQSYRVLDEESARVNEAGLIRCGFDSLALHAEDFLTDVFLHHPRTLCRTSRTLGLLAGPQRHTIVKEVMESPLVSPNAEMPATALVDLFDRHGPKLSASPIPKRLRRYIGGEIKMTRRQLDRAADVVRRAWPTVICNHLHELALAHMARNLGSDDVDLAEVNDQMLHALKLQADVDENRRGIRRLLRACHRGDEDYLRQHPRNLEWLAAHADIGHRWLDGVKLTRELEGLGPVTLALEQNPLEALRMGTYVGSCLGLGGPFSWSAAGIVLDVNKQVVFARDASGRFLARQVLACTEEDTLACYSIYPKSSDELEQLFRDFDVAFAEHLAIDVTTERDTTIPSLVATGWWDDGLWTDGVGTAPSRKLRGGRRANAE